MPGGALDGIKEPEKGFVIRGGRAALPSGSWLPWPVPLEVVILEPIAPPADDDTEGVNRVRLEARAAILAVLGEPDLEGSGQRLAVGRQGGDW